MYDTIDIIAAGLSIILTCAGIACTIGGSICLFSNKNGSEECYLSFAIGVSILLGVLAISLFLWGLNKLDSISLKRKATSRSSGPILPLSSSPNAPSKSLKIHKNSLAQAHRQADRPRSLTQ